MRKTTGIDRSLTSYGDPEFSKYLRRTFLASAGYDKKDLARPIVGIADTSSDYTTCHRHMPEVVEAVKRGVLEAGGLPMVFPTISLGEILISPTSMLYRNLLAMETEEMIRAYPMDSVVLVGGCDKTVPAQLMAAVSANVPALSVVVGPMQTGSDRGEAVGAGTDCRRFWAQYRAGKVGQTRMEELQEELCPASGTCMVMGSASTMACLTEALGLMLPGGATPLSGSGDRLRHAVASGRQAVRLAKSGPRPKEIVTAKSIRNAIAVLVALGGSTNAVIHLTAIARRAGVRLNLDHFHSIARKVPLLVDCKPSGAVYLSDFGRAGGVSALMKTLSEVLEKDALTVTAKPLGRLLTRFKGPQAWQNVIHTIDDPLGQTCSLVSLRGSLAPDGAIIKKSAASQHLLRHEGPAVVFEGPEDAARRIDDPSLALTPDHVIVMRNAGPKACGMPEAGSLPIPRYLSERGVTDMVRVSDARMSGTAFGTIVLHCAPEAVAGGPLALVCDGDRIALDVHRRKIELLVTKAELARRRRKLKPFSPPKRGWQRLHALHVLQANDGADLDFLTT